VTISPGAEAALPRRSALDEASFTASLTLVRMSSMSARLEEFLEGLPSRGVGANMVPMYRTALEAFEASLGKAVQGRFSKYEINRFVTQRQRAGASEREVRNLGVACDAYLAWHQAKEPPPPAVLPGAAGTSSAELLEPPATPAQQAMVLANARLIAVGILVLVLALIGGCIADQAAKGRRVERYSAAVRGAGKRATMDRKALERRVLELAKEHGVRVKPERVVASVNELTPENAARLAPDERIRAIMALQQAQSERQHMRMRAMQEGSPRAMRESPSGLPRELPRESPSELRYVEIDIIGEAPGIFGRQEFQFEHHVVAGLDPVAAP
jgi:hypothetical protein